MPKDWLRYKAEVHRLYIVEEKTVYQVRDILRERHGFSASVRAYRMHFDEWGMKKYKSTKAKSKSTNSRHLSSPPTSTISTTPTVSSVSATPPAAFSSAFNMGDTRGASEPVPDVRNSEAGRPLSLMGRLNLETPDPLQTLETLFTNWQYGPELSTALTTYFRDPRFNKWVVRHSGSGSPVVFELVNEYVPEKERFNLIKSLLEADLSTRSHRNFHSNSWQESWYEACDVTGWEEARDLLLYDGGELSQTPGVFRDCALVILAEGLLTRYMNELDRWRGRQLTVDDADLKSELISRCRGILGYFHHGKENVDPRFYRSFLTLELDGEVDGTLAHRPADDDFRLTYLQLSSLRAPTDWSLGNSKQRKQSPSTQSGSFVSPNSTTHSLPPTPPTPSDSKPFDQLPHFSTTSTLTFIKKKWHLLDGFEDYLQTLFPYDGSQIFIFSPGQPPAENLLDAMVHSIPSADERLALTKAILIVSSTSGSYPAHTYSHLLNWWRNLYSPNHTPTYEQFHSHLLQNSSLASSLEHTIGTPEGRKLFMDAAVSLVADRLLRSLKTSLEKKRESNTRSLEKRNRCWNILDALRKRDLRVDEWTRYLLDTM